MDFQSVPWRRKRSSGMSICETESSGSLSSFETYSGELDVLRTSAVGSSQDDTQPSSSKSVEAEDTIKSLTEKLSDARMSLRAKEDLVKQHAKVAEEALFGWENSEKEVASLKQHLKAAKQKNSSLEERLGQVDDALKECVRQLGQSREEQEKRIQDAIVKKTCELESHKSELETHLIVLQKQLKEKAKKHNSFNCELCSKIEMLEKENASLKVELMSLNESLRARTLEMEFSIRAAEMASKQHLESIKKVAKLEAECRSLHARTHKPSLSNDHRLICNSLYGESLTDSQSDSAERLCGLDNELSVPDSWASALITELDQFKNEKAITKCLNCPIEIELMDDFLEMERLAATTDADYGSSSFEHDTDLDTVIPRQSSPRYNIQSIQQQIAMLEERIKQMSVERGEMEASLSKTNCQLKISQDQLTVVEGELVELHRQFNFVSAEKHTQLIKLEILEANRKNMELELESAAKEIGHLKNGIEFLEGGVKVEKPPLIAVFSTGCQRMEALDSEIKEKGTENELLKRETMRSHDNKNILVEEMEEEKTVFEECTFRYQNLDSSVEKVKELNSQLESVTLEPPKKHEKFDLTERSEVLSSQPIANCRIIEAIDAKERQVDYENSSEGLEIPELEEKTDLSKTKVEEEMPLSSELGSDLDSQVAKKIELVVQLELEQREVRSLQDKVHILEKKIDKEKALAAEYAARCYALENELSWNKLADIQQSANSDESSKIRQGNEVAQAGGRLAKCQKTIASLNLQLKSLATLDDFLFDANMPDPTDEPIKHNGDPRLLDFGGSPEKIGGCSSHLNDTPGLSFAHCSEISPPSSTVEAMSRNPSTLVSEKETESNHF